MDGVTVRHWMETPARFQETFATRDLDDCILEHSLFALPGPRCNEQLARDLESEDKLDEEHKANQSKDFKVLLDVVQFRPEDIIIQIFEGWLVIKGEHQSRMDEHGFVSRSFTRIYKLPPGTESKDLFAVFCHDGVLAVEGCAHE